MYTILEIKTRKIKFLAQTVFRSFEHYLASIFRLQKQFVMSDRNNLNYKGLKIDINAFDVTRITR